MLHTSPKPRKLALPKFEQGTTPEEVGRLFEQARKASELLKALSHETRLSILCLIAEEEKSVTELELTLSIAQAIVSQQLARLRQDGLVKTRREGRTIYYSVASDEVSELVGELHGLFYKPDQKSKLV